MKSIGWDTSFHLNGKFPLLDNSIFPSLNAAKLFVSDSTSSAIAGTIIGVDDPSNSNETGLYEIFNDSGELALRKLVSEGTLASYKTKIDSLITDLSGNYSSELAELAAQQAKQLETLRDEMFSPDNDTTPVTRTMMLQVGADSTNYRFSTNEIGSKDTDGIVFNSSDKSLTFLSGTLYHFSITDDSGKPRTWSISASPYIELENTETSLGEYIHLSDYIKNGESLWIYLKVPKTGEYGNWLLSPKKYACILDETQSPGEGLALGDSAYYYLLYGYCGVVPAGSPFFEPVYGNTWIKGSTIYTGKVQTMDGQSVLDLDNDTLKLGDAFYYANGQVVVGNPDTGAFVFHKHEDNTALHVGTMTKDSNGTESWNGMTFANGELTIGKYEEKLKEMQTQLDKEVSTWYGQGIPLPYKESEDKNIVESVASELVASYNETLTTDENGVKMFNLSPDPEPLPRHINDIYINSITGVGYRLVVSNWGIEGQQVYWLQLSQWDLQNILNQLNGVNTEVGNIKKALDIADGSTVIGDKFIETMMLRIGADSTNYTLTKTSTSGNRMQNLQWSVDDSNVKLNVSEGENLHHSVYYWTDPLDNRTKTYDWAITKPIDSIINVSKTSTTPYYLYIKCSKTSNTAEWLATATARSLQDSLYYYFPFGTVVDPSTKTLVEVRGNTKIVGDRIITGKLESNTGNSFFDLDNGQFALGVDQNNPTDLDKAAFSFDGSKVHIGGNLGLEYKWNKQEYIDSFNLSISNIPSKTYIGEVPGLARYLCNTKTGGKFQIKYSNGSLPSGIDYSLEENTFGIDGNFPYFICIGEPNIDPETHKLTNSLYDFTDQGEMYTCEFTIKESQDIYIIRGTTDKNGERYNFSNPDDDPNRDLCFYIRNIYINKWSPIMEDQGLRGSLSAGSTDISGGLVLTNCLGVRNSAGVVTAGINGIHDNNNKTAFWAGSNIDEKEEAPVKITADGIGSKIGPLTVKDQDSVTIEGEGPDLQFINSVSGGTKTLTLSGKYLEQDKTDSIVDSTDYFKLPVSSLDKGEYKKNSGNSQNTFTLFSQSISINNKSPLECYDNEFSGTITPNVFNGIKVSFTKSSFSEPWHTTISMYYNLKLVVSNGSYTQTIFDRDNWWIKYECDSNDSAATYTIPIDTGNVNLNANILKPGTVKVSLLFTINKFYRIRAASSWSYQAGNPLYNNLDITITRPNISSEALLTITRKSTKKANVTSPKQRSEIGMNGFRFKYGNALFNARIINYSYVPPAQVGELQGIRYANQLIINLSGLPVIERPNQNIPAGVLMVNNNGVLCITGDKATSVHTNEVDYNTMEDKLFNFKNIGSSTDLPPMAQA